LILQVNQCHRKKSSNTVIIEAHKHMGTNSLIVILVSRFPTYGQKMSSKSIGDVGMFPDK
jgi:hypothetical protein